MSKWGLQYAHKTDAFASTPMWARDAALALQLVPRKGSVFLDLGCGTGRLISLVQSTAQYERIIGVDVNEQGLRLARELVGPKPELHMTMQSVADRSVDACVIMHALPQFEDPMAMLTELWEKMTPGGLIVAIVHSLNYTRLRHPVNKLIGYKGDSTITTHFTKGSLMQMMRDAGFSMIKASYYGGNWTKLIPFCQPRMYFHGRRPV